MELPILENGVPAGVLRLRPQGLYTRFEARLPPAPGLTRLWLLGAGGRACLGVMEPRREGRFLLRRLTRLELSRLPCRPERVLALPAEAAPPAPRARHGEAGSQTGRGDPLPPSKENTDRPVAPLPAVTAGQPSWTRLADGSLFDPARRLLALPCAPGAAPERGRKILPDGREYWLFRT